MILAAFRFPQVHGKLIVPIHGRKKHLPAVIHVLDSHTILFLNIFKKAEERVIMKTVMRNETFSNNRSGI